MSATEADSHGEQIRALGAYFVETFTGRRFYFDTVENNDISILDIAHALSNNCRYTGHTRRFYSVAEHCYTASRAIDDPALALPALLHDASEAYLHDMPSPLKWWLRDRGFTILSELDARVEATIFRAFGVDWTPEVAAAVKIVDRRMLATEQRDLMPTADWPGGLPPYEFSIDCHRPEVAEGLFMERFLQLRG